MYIIFQLKSDIIRKVWRICNVSIYNITTQYKVLAPSLVSHLCNLTEYDSENLQFTL